MYDCCHINYTCKQYSKDAKRQLTMFAVFAREPGDTGTLECMVRKVLVTFSSVLTLSILVTHQFCSTSACSLHPWLRLCN